MHTDTCCNIPGEGPLEGEGPPGWPAPPQPALLAGPGPSALAPEPQPARANGCTGWATIRQEAHKQAPMETLPDPAPQLLGLDLTCS
eukprot:1152526-Pelagomonas_calceolata.AAC.2